MSLLDRLRSKPKGIEIRPTSEEVKYAQQQAESFRNQLGDYVMEPSVARAFERLFLAEGCREYGVVLRDAANYEAAAEEVQRAYLLLPSAADFCLLATIFESASSEDAMINALHQAQVELVNPDRALNTPAKLLEWLGVEGDAAGVGKILQEFLEARAVARIIPDEMRTANVRSNRERLLQFTNEMIEYHARTDDPDEEKYCPHCNQTVRPDDDHATCPSCGALVVLRYSETGIRPLVLYERWPSNTALNELVEKSVKGTDFASALPMLATLLRRAGEQYGIANLFLLKDAEREHVRKNFEGLQLIAFRAALPTIFENLRGYFEDHVLGSLALDAILIDLCCSDVTSDVIAHDYWLTPMKEKGTDWWKMRDLKVAMDAAQLLELEDPLSAVNATVAMTSLLDYDVTAVTRFVLYGEEMVDSDRRQFFDKVYAIIERSGAKVSQMPYLPLVST